MSFHGKTLTLGVLTTLVLVGLPAGPALAAPNRPDLVVSASADPATVVDVGGGSAVRVDVRNAGTKAAQDVTVSYTMPPGGFFTDGNSVPEGWQCDFREDLSCTHGPFAAGASATLRFFVSFPAAQVGQTATVTAVASTSGSELSTANNTGQATVSYIRGVTDLAITNLYVTEQARIGDTVGITVDVTNTGNMTAEEVYVTVPVPAGLQPQSEEFGEGWYCDFLDDPAAGGPAWRCTRYQLVNGWGDSLNLWATVRPAASPGDSVPVRATVTTSSPEDNLQDNSGLASVSIL
ncbi:CARDB domain-containing protein [Asanoa sp. NPDC049518]|uniref:CARDB domain-containing protein n=1 Tax=unclassified Asanoa TaxID=2685164 RepID=UPI0034123749